MILLNGEAGAAFAVSNVDNTRDKTSLLLSPSRDTLLNILMYR
jgi:hypothetical protein